jgi:hypothetical protein
MATRTHSPWLARRPLVPRQLGWWSTLGCSSIVLGADPPCHSNECGTSQPTEADRGVTAEAPDNGKVHPVNSPLERQSAPSPSTVLRQTRSKRTSNRIDDQHCCAVIVPRRSGGCSALPRAPVADPYERAKTSSSVNQYIRPQFPQNSRCTRRTAAWPKWSDARSAGIPERRHAVGSRRGKRARLRSRAAHPEVVRVLLRRLALQRTRSARSRSIPSPLGLDFARP